MTDSSENSTSQNDEPFDPASWVDRHGDVLYRYAVSRLRNREAAEEVVQETFVAGLRARDQYAGDGVEGAWLMGILRRKVIDYVRKRGREINEPEDQIDFGVRVFDQSGRWQNNARLGDVPSEATESDEFFAQLSECLRKLPERQASAFVLRELEKQSTEEICETLDIEPANLSVLLYRARAKLATCLTQYIGESQAIRLAGKQRGASQ